MKQNDAHVESALLTTTSAVLTAPSFAPLFYSFEGHERPHVERCHRESARKEFEEGKGGGSQLVNRLILSGREAVDVALDRFMEQRQKIIDERIKYVW